MTCPVCGRDIATATAHLVHVRSHDEAAAEARFWSKVDRSGGPDACWPWTGHRNTRLAGYGRLNDRFGRDMAHRRAWILTNGPIPDGYRVRHLVCDNQPCCNPRHLAAVAHRRTTKGRSFREQAARGSRKANAKFTEADIPVIRSLVASGLTHREVADRYGVSGVTIGFIATRRSWKHVP